MQYKPLPTYPPGSDGEYMRDEEIFALFVESANRPKPSRGPAPVRQDDTERFIAEVGETF
ncbi:MAG: hypothetical protein MUC50_13350 [Myxococcota bacterium]|jgi:hypothetical protein|nr:hypothetical protein [Myxococcota bacterium]